MADSGDTLAQFEYGDYLVSYSDNEKLGIDYLTKAAINDLAIAQNHLGDMYYNGDSVEKDYIKAFEWYHKAAELGYAAAQYNLGIMYAKGEGVEKDYTKAYEWYSKPAEHGIHSPRTLAIVYYADENR